jgi:NADH:ubiquinone oxidoreductase subunit D
MQLEDQRSTVYKVDPEHPERSTLPTLRTEELLLNMGPQHPSTHGVLKVILELEGERIVKATPVMGFLHRGVEKLAEDGKADVNLVADFVTLIANKKAEFNNATTNEQRKQAILDVRKAWKEFVGKVREKGNRT